jgi:hypothetical protein
MLSLDWKFRILTIRAPEEISLRLSIRRLQLHVSFASYVRRIERTISVKVRMSAMSLHATLWLTNRPQALSDHWETLIVVRVSMFLFILRIQSNHLSNIFIRLLNQEAKNSNFYSIPKERISICKQLLIWLTLNLKSMGINLSTMLIWSGSWLLRTPPSRVNLLILLRHISPVQLKIGITLTHLLWLPIKMKLNSRMSTTNWKPHIRFA